MGKSRIQPIKNGLQENNVVQKSTPLQSLWKSELGLGEFKVLDTYLSRINSRKPEQKTVRFSKKEFESLLGIKEVKPKVLQQYTDNLMRQIVSLDDPECKKGFRRISLFCESACWQDEETGEYWVEMTCSPQAMKYVFNVEQLGYLRYKLRNVLQITSRYSYVLFVYLENNRFRKSWEIPLEELRQLLGCWNDESYNEFKIFNNRILKRCEKEISERTELKYEYEPLRKGRKVEKIRFTVKSSIPDFEQVSFDELPHPDGGTGEPEGRKFENENLAFLADAVEYQFDEGQMQLLFDALAVARPSGSVKDLDLARYDLLSHKFHELQNRERRPDLKPIKNRLSYLCRLIRKEAPEN